MAVQEIEEMIPPSQQKPRPRLILQSMEILGNVTKMLQHEDTTLDAVRALFDTVMKHFPSTVLRLSKDEEIVESKSIEIMRSFPTVAPVHRNNISLAKLAMVNY